MINSLWISKTGMEAQQMQLDVISNNLANVSTNGFKKSHAVFEDLMYQNLRQVGSTATEQSTLPTGLQIGLGVRTVATSRTFSQGNLQQSNNNLDAAIQGNGFFQITMPDGTTGYTRDGGFATHVVAEAAVREAGREAGQRLVGAADDPDDPRRVEARRRRRASDCRTRRRAARVRRRHAGRLSRDARRADARRAARGLAGGEFIARRRYKRYLGLRRLRFRKFKAEMANLEL